MGLHSDTEIYAAVVALAKYVAEAVREMRRDVKPTLGKMLVEECVWMGVVVRRINIARDQAKVPLLEELLEQIEIVQFVLRLSRDCRYIAVSTFADSVPLTASIGKQATALRNHFAPAP